MTTPVTAPARPLAVIGVDPGARWTAACLRVGDQAVNAFTLGPVDRAGALTPEALDDIDNWDAFRRYLQRIGDALDALVDEATHDYGGVRIGVEVPFIPRGFRNGVAERWNRIPVNDWVMPKQVAAGVIALYPAARLVVPDKLGRRPAQEYPRELRGPRLPGWGPCEARRGERDHERSAYDVAGLAAGMP